MKNSIKEQKPLNKKAGVHIGFNGKFIVSVPAKSPTSVHKFEALSQHDNEEIANDIFNDYMEQLKKS